jgi:hypothetical protein
MFLNQLTLQVLIFIDSYQTIQILIKELSLNSKRPALLIEKQDPKREVTYDSVTNLACIPLLPQGSRLAFSFQNFMLN